MNIFYNVNKWEEAERINSPYSLIIDMSDGWDEEKSPFVRELVMETDRTKRLSKLLIKINYEDYIKSESEIFTEAYIQFQDEEKYIEEILKLEELDRVVGKETCKTQTDIYRYSSVGIKNLYITSPLINDVENLKSVKETNDLLFFAIMNRDNSLKDSVDTSWVRPEALEEYQDVIENIEIVSDDNVKITAAFRAYYNRKWLGKLSEIVVGFGRKENPYKDIYNFFPTDYNTFITNCGDAMYTKTQLKRQYQTAKMITERELH